MNNNNINKNKEFKEEEYLLYHQYYLLVQQIFGCIRRISRSYYSFYQEKKEKYGPGCLLVRFYNLLDAFQMTYNENHPCQYIPLNHALKIDGDQDLIYLVEEECEMNQEKFVVIVCIIIDEGKYQYITEKRLFQRFETFDTKPRDNTKFCFVCGKILNLEPNFCSSCRIIPYCSKSCQERDRKNGHDQICKMYQKYIIIDNNNNKNKKLREYDFDF